MKKLIVLLALTLTIGSITTLKAQEDNAKKHSITALGAFNPNKTGVGLRYTYDFTKILRFTLDGTYYLTAKNTIDVVNSNNVVINTLNYGRAWDANANFNFVYGEKKFHFYFILGLGFTYGYKWDRSGLFNDGQLTENNFPNRVGVTTNAGFGIEYQFTPAFRWNLEQNLSIGLPSLSTWMCKTGFAYCF